MTSQKLTDSCTLSSIAPSLVYLYLDSSSAVNTDEII